MKRAPSLGTPSIYSHTTTRSIGLRSARSIKSLQIPWYKTPWLQQKFGKDIQKYSLFAAILFNCYKYIHYRNVSLRSLLSHRSCTWKCSLWLLHYLFRFCLRWESHCLLITIAILSTLAALALCVTGIMLIQALRKEHERRMVPWLICMFAFATFRLVSFIFSAIVNDLIFPYNIIMCIFWVLITLCNFIGLVFVYSLYLELADLTKLEDLAHLRMGTMTSLATQSIAGSRPTTPHSTSSTVPLP